MDDVREIGAPAKISDLYNVRFSSSFVFENDEIVLVARSKGGFTYGVVKKIVSRKQHCYMDKNVNHTVLEYRVLVEDNPPNTKGLPACYIGKINPEADAYDEDEAEDGEFDVKERVVGGKPIPEDLRTIVFGVSVVIPKIGDYILVPRSRGGFCYGIVEKQMSTTCPISDQPRHGVISYRAAIDSDPTNPLHKEIASIYLGLLINPRAISPFTPKLAPQIPKNSDSQSPRMIPEKCGECEEELATLECKNCSEFYCADCCDIIHSKGQRKLHKNIVPVTRSKPQVYTSAANAGQQMISVAKPTTKTNSNALPGFDLSSIFAAPNLIDLKAPTHLDASKPTPSASKKAVSSPPHSPKSKADDSPSVPKQKQIFPRGSRTSSPSIIRSPAAAASASAVSEPKKAASPVVFDDDSDDEPLVIPQPPGKGKAAAPVVFNDDDSDTEIKTLKRPTKKTAGVLVLDDDDSDTEIKTLKRPTKAAAPVVFNDDDSDSDTEIKTLKRPSKKNAESDDEGIVTPRGETSGEESKVPFQKASSKPNFSGAPTMKRPSKVAESDEEEESEDEEFLAAPKKLTLDSDDEDDEDFGVIATLKRPSKK